MKILKFAIGNDPTPRVGLIEGADVVELGSGTNGLSELLHAPNVEDTVRRRRAETPPVHPVAGVRILAPIDRHEVWGAGVTYERSKKAREDESEKAATFYDMVYRAPRPELFFKATPGRVVGPGQAIRVRNDSQWTVPEPELALWLAPDLRLVGYTIGNDVSARDVEGENPLYLPQGKVYDACCALGPVVALASSVPDATDLGIRMSIVRGRSTIFEGVTSTNRMAREFDELVDWLSRDNVFPDGVVLLTGTGLVPPDDFSLEAGDRVRIEVDGVGAIENPVVRGAVEKK